MRFLSVSCLLFTGLVGASAADNLKSKTTYSKAYGETKNAVTVDPAKDLPHYPAVEPKDAIATWKVKKGFHLELTANEPQVRDPIAMTYDEHGRLFACEMIDYSEMRDVTPHLGRISMLQDKDGDGHFETSNVFADDLAWPTGLIWANGGLYVIATPDIWFLKDADGDGKAEIREIAFTGFGTGLKLVNVQGLANSPQWGQDNRIHILAGGGNRGVITSPKRPDLKGIELGGRDFWFDPKTHEFGLEGGGAQYGMSFDNYGRKFGCSNSDHLQYWLYDDRYTGRNPYFAMPSARQSISADGGACEVFRISPDEPWRIIRTRWRIAGVVKGAVEGGGRVSGYFTGATGTTIYRGDAYGPDFVNNSFSGDAGGQLVHRKIITPTEDGISLVGHRPADEQGFEFAASRDTWVRVVNFANSPDGCLHIIDMYREVIEHPWSIPDEIKKHLDLNNGNDRGRIYRITPDRWTNSKDKFRSGNIAKATTDELVGLLGHSNGWHRDTAQRLLYERQDKSAVPALEKLLNDGNELAKLHALGALQGLGVLSAEHVNMAAADKSAAVREAAIKHMERLGVTSPTVATLANDSSAHVQFQLALTLPQLPVNETTSHAAVTLAKSKAASESRLADALASSPPAFTKQLITVATGELRQRLLTIVGASRDSSTIQQAIQSLLPYSGDTASLSARATGLAKAGSNLQKADTTGALKPVLDEASSEATNAALGDTPRIKAIQLLSLFGAEEVIQKCLDAQTSDSVQTAAVRQLGASSAVLKALPNLSKTARTQALEQLLGSDKQTMALLTTNAISPTELSASQVQSLIKHKNAEVAALARTALASVIPPSREEVVAKFKPALELKGDATKGQTQYMQRCMACHRAKETGIAVGPDLVTVKTKGRDGILTAILEPHKEVAAQFIAYTVATKDGQTLNGIIAEDTATSLTLKLMGGVNMPIQRSNIKGTSSTGQSLMPEGLEQGMSPQDMADLLTFIESL